MRKPWAIGLSVVAAIATLVCIVVIVRRSASAIPDVPDTPALSEDDDAAAAAAAAATNTITPEETALMVKGFEDEYKRLQDEEDVKKAAEAATGTAGGGDPPPPSVLTTSPPVTKDAYAPVVPIDFDLVPALSAMRKQKRGVAGFFADNQNAGLVIGVGIQAALPSVLEKMLKFKIRGGLYARASVYMLKTTASLLKGLKVVLDALKLTRLGVQAARGAALATKLADQATAAIASGPGFPVAMAAMLAFDVISIGLDLGDAGGYNKMGSKKIYLRMKEGIDREIKKAYDENGVPYPAIIGPLDQMAPERVQKLMEAVTKKILSAEGNPYMTPILEGLLARDFSTEAEIDAYLTAATDSIDMDALYADALSRLCLDSGGKLLGKAGACSWATQKQCDSSYTWPIKAESDEMYAEWRPDAGGPGKGACVSASFGVRGICAMNDLPYDSLRGICAITETYCKTKGADWKYDDELKEYDCHLSTGQSILEGIFGSTITRGLKQILSGEQYSKCAEGEVDDGFTCRAITCPAGKEPAGILGETLAGGSTALLASGVGLLGKAQRCYEPCRKGYIGSSFMCYKNCEDLYGPGFKNEGAFCSKITCEKTEEHEGRLCYPACKEGYKGTLDRCYQRCPDGFKDDGLTSCAKPASYGRGAGRVPDKAPCPDGMRDDATSCWADIYTPGAYTIANKDRCRDQHPEGCEKLGLLYYPLCRPGYTKKGLTCIPDGGAGIKKTLAARQSCKATEERNGALCYPKCKAGFHAVGCCTCSRDCPAGMKDTGTTCIKDSTYRGVGRPDLTSKKGDGYDRGGGVLPTGTKITAKHRVVPFSTKNN